jgi:hypothetical protein
MVTIESWVPLIDAQQAMLEADFLFSSLGTGKESATFIPSKLFEYIAAKRPIIGIFPEGEAGSLIQETNTGRVFSTDDPLPIVNYLHDAIVKKENGSLPYQPNEAVVNKYYIHAIVDKLAYHLDRILQGR